MGVFAVTVTRWGGPLPRLELGFFKISDLWNSAAPLPTFQLSSKAQNHFLGPSDRQAKLTGPQTSLDVGRGQLGRQLVVSSVCRVWDGAEALLGISRMWRGAGPCGYAGISRQDPPASAGLGGSVTLAFRDACFLRGSKPPNPPVSFWFRNHLGGERGSSLSISPVPWDEYPHSSPAITQTRRAIHNLSWPFLSYTPPTRAGCWRKNWTLSPRIHWGSSRISLRLTSKIRPLFPYKQV